MIALSLLLLQAGSSAANPVQVDQLPAPAAGVPARRLPSSPSKSGQVAITQLPPDLTMVADADETELVNPPNLDASPSRAAVELARAIGIIRGRGQQVTPELLAQEVAPEVLEIYLSNPGAFPAATGLPDQAVPAVPPGVTIIPPKGN